MTATARFSGPTASAASRGDCGRALVIDDDDQVANAIARVLKMDGLTVDMTNDGNEALRRVRDGDFDVVITDIAMPECDGITLLREIRRVHPELPVILLTGYPSLDTAVHGVDYGAFSYLTKPIESKRLLRAVHNAVSTSAIAKARRRVLDLIGDATRTIGETESLEKEFLAAKAQLCVLYQPIVSCSERRVVGFESFMRSSESTLSQPKALLGAAERLGRIQELSRALQRLHVASLSKLPRDTSLYVNLHPTDLLDENLFRADGPLRGNAQRIVFEITERVPLDRVPGLLNRVDELKAIGYRIALDDVGVGYAGLSTLAILQPDIVKLDAGLVRRIDSLERLRIIVEAMVSACCKLDTVVIAEAVESEAERKTLESIGVDLMQGHLFATPQARFITSEQVFGADELPEARDALG